MSDPTHDPIRDLENFGTGGVHANPLGPDQVRRLGDERRTRRRTTAALAAACLAVVTAVVPMVLLSAEDDQKPVPPLVTPSTTPTPTPTHTPTRAPSPTPTPSTAPTGAPERVVTYPSDLGVPGVLIYSADDVAKLRGASEDFRAYIGDVIQTMRKDADCPASEQAGRSDTRPVVTVTRFSTNGYAVGSTSGGCGGHAALWTRVNGIWGEAIPTQEDVLSCAALEDAGVPVSFVGSCAGENGSTVISGDFGPTSVDGVALGMKRAHVESVGASLVAGPGQCDYLFQAHTDPPPAGSDIAEVDGFVYQGRVVALEALGIHQTPEGIGIGSSRAAVERAYPGGRFDPRAGSTGYWVAPLGNGNQYRFAVSGEPATVSQMQLSQTGTPCF